MLMLWCSRSKRRASWGQSRGGTYAPTTPAWRWATAMPGKEARRSRAANAERRMAGLRTGREGAWNVAVGNRRRPPSVRWGGPGRVQGFVNLARKRGDAEVHRRNAWG